MGWEKGRYYTRSHKINGRVIREYVGGGVAGELAAQLDAMERNQRESERKAWQLERDRIEAFDESIAEICQTTEIIAQAAMMAAGFHHHRGEWRRRRVRNDRT